jgi:hypothetical protein
MSFEHLADIAKSEKQRPLRLTDPLGQHAIAIATR